MTVTPTVEKEAEIQAFARKLAPKSKVTIRQLACFIGMVVAILPACEHRKMHYRALERDKIFNLKAHKGNYDAQLTLTDPSKQELL